MSEKHDHATKADWLKAKSLMTAQQKIDCKETVMLLDHLYAQFDHMIAARKANTRAVALRVGMEVTKMLSQQAGINEAELERIVNRAIAETEGE